MKRYIVRWYNTDLAQKDWHRVPEELQRQVNETLTRFAAEGTKLVSLVPAPPNVPEGFYLATFEVTE